MNGIPLRNVDDRPAGGAAPAATAGAAVVEAALDQLGEAMDRLAGVDTATLPEGCVATAVRRLAKVDDRIEGIQARFVATAERARLPERSGAGSTTTWLKQQTGRSGGQAARTNRLARSSETAPELAAAVANGEIGPDQANTIASGMERGEFEAEDVAELLPAARRLPPDMFRRQARQQVGHRRQERLRDQELVARAARYYRQWRTPDGSLRYEGQLPPADGDLLETGISAFYQPDGKDVPDDMRRTHEQRSADAMRDLVAGALRAGEAGDVGGVRPHVAVTVPVEAMAPLADAAQAGLTGLSGFGTVLTMAAYKKLACDATVRRVVIGPDSEPVDIGRATRQWPAPMRAAIAAVDGSCRGPGCDLPPSRCILHHIRWWEGGGDTSVANGVMTCDVHHDVVHDDGWTLQMDPTTRICTCTSPDGETTVITYPDGPAARGAGAQHMLDVGDAGDAGNAGDTGDAGDAGNAGNAGDETPPGSPDVPNAPDASDMLDETPPNAPDASDMLDETPPDAPDAPAAPHVPDAPATSGERTTAPRTSPTARPRGRGDPARPRGPGGTGGTAGASGTAGAGGTAGASGTGPDPASAATGRAPPDRAEAEPPTLGL